MHWLIESSGFLYTLTLLPGALDTENILAILERVPSRGGNENELETFGKDGDIFNDTNGQYSLEEGNLLVVAVTCHLKFYCQVSHEGAVKNTGCA